MLIKNDPTYNEAWPRAVVPYRAVHGVDEPAELPWLPNDGTRARRRCRPARRTASSAPAASTSARASPASSPPWSDTFDGLDAFNTSENGQSSNWVHAGRRRRQVRRTPTSGRCASSRMEPNTHRSYGPQRRPERRPALRQPRRRAAAHPRRDPAAQVRRRRRADPRSRGQSRHQLPGEDSRRHAVHVPDARPQRPGAEHGADLAPGAARRGAQRLRRLPRAQPAAARLRRHRRGAARAIQVADLVHDDAAADARTRRAIRRCARSTPAGRSTSSSSATSGRSCSAAACRATPRTTPNPPGNLVLDDYADRTAACPATTRASPTTRARAVGLPAA